MLPTLLGPVRGIARLVCAARQPVATDRRKPRDGYGGAAPILLRTSGIIEGKQRTGGEIYCQGVVWDILHFLSWRKGLFATRTASAASPIFGVP
jgi:hypothetical protein